ncbi:MAG: hypothetical protein AB1449_00505 [Chloroflexota bacterium]
MGAGAPARSTLLGQRWCGGLLLALALTLSGCSAPPLTPATPQPSPAPTDSPSSPEQAGPGPDSTPTRSPLTEATPAIVLEPPAPTPTATLPASPARLPPERLAILAPGPGSQVTSPFTLSGRSGPIYLNRVRIRLIGEDGRVITQRVTYLWAPPGYSGVFTTEISFQIEAVAEAARLELSTDDLRSARLGHVTTLNLVLLSAGAPLVYPALDGPERLTILSPREGAVVSGGRVRVRGAGWTEADVPLTVQLLDRYHTVLGAAEVELVGPGVGQLGTFEVEISYRIPYAQYAWVAVAESTPDGSALIHFSSHEIWLEP